MPHEEQLPQCKVMFSNMTSWQKSQNGKLDRISTKLDEHTDKLNTMNISNKVWQNRFLTAIVILMLGVIADLAVKLVFK